MFLDKLLKQLSTGYREEITGAAQYHDAAAFLRAQMATLPDAADPSAGEAYEDFLRSDGPVQKQFRILDEQVSSLLQDPDVAKDWYDLVPVWFRVNNRIREALPTLPQISSNAAPKTIIVESRPAAWEKKIQEPMQLEKESEQEEPPSDTMLLRKQNRAEQLSRLRTSGKRAITLLSGAAGTGKTFQIEERVRYLTDRLQVLPETILLLAPTFEKAERLGLKYHLELQVPVSLACVSKEDAAFTKDDIAYTHILLDDLQHFSAKQLELIAGLAERFPNAGWFCTVDDWQTLHGDYHNIYEFRRIFPSCEEETLVKVYRHSEELAENAALFVTADPLHIRKQLEAEPCGKPGIHIVTYPTVTGVNRFPQALSLAQQLAGPGSLLLPVHTLQDANIIRHYFHRPILPCTPEQLQDMEADSVIIPPSFFVRMRCPILEAATPRDHRLPARERRLLYSALTRSRGCTIILTPLEYQSAFVKELQELPVKVHHLT